MPFCQHTRNTINQPFATVSIPIRCKLVFCSYKTILNVYVAYGHFSHSSRKGSFVTNCEVWLSFCLETKAWDLFELILSLNQITERHQSTVWSENHCNCSAVRRHCRAFDVKYLRRDTFVFWLWAFDCVWVHYFLSANKILLGLLLPTRCVNTFVELDLVTEHTMTTGQCLPTKSVVILP